jgi:crotonobetainyl-CoA:carnitine CoA-transferase CaiB-like acyl-CoA transferase
MWLLNGLGARCSWWQWQQPAPGEWPAADQRFRAFFEHNAEVIARGSSLHRLLADLPRVAASYDLIITDFCADELAQGELLALLQPYNPAIVVANADHFGRHGPYAHWAGDEFTDYALGGYWSLGGDMDKAPLRVPGRQAQFHGGMQLAIASLAALHHARLTGHGQEVQVSAAEAMLGAHWSTTVAWTHEGRILQRAGCDLVRAKDGWVFFYAFIFENLLVLIDRPDLLGDPRWSTPQGLFANREDLKALVVEWAQTKTVDEIVPAAQDLRIPVTSVGTAESLLADSQLNERGYFRELDGARLPGLPYRWTESWDIPPPQPMLDAALAATPAPIAPAAMATAAPASNSEGPLTGLRVIEITNNWAGPIAGRHLGDLGAEVIKVELATKPATRVSHYPAVQPGKYHWNRSGYFNEMNRNKRDISLNLGTEAGRNVLFALARWADVLVENNSARVMPNLRLGYDALAAENPRLIMASISGFGATGPLRDWVAYGSNIEAACGLAAMTGYDDSTPYRTGSFVADPIAGGHAVVAILAALERRDRTGEGDHIDIALTESAIPFMLESFTHYAATGQLMPRRGNIDPDSAPTGAYRCAGTDDWVAIAVRTDGQWRALCAAAGLTCDASWSNAERLQHRAEIDAALDAWTTTQSQQEAVRLLQSHRIPAAPILHNWQLHSDPHFFARNAFIPIDHPDTGVLPYPGFPWEFSLTKPSVRMAAPRFGEGNRYVFGHLLGMDEDQVRRLYDDHVTTDEPIGITAISV